MSPTQTEEKVQFYLNNTKSKLNNTYETLKVYWDATLATFQKFWQL
jgi:hypothetical protein